MLFRDHLQGPEHGVTACGGRIVVEFVDSSGQILDLQPGQQVRVYEHDDTCDLLETDRDRYDFFLCEDSTGAGRSIWSRLRYASPTRRA